MIERWLPIAGYEGVYEISSFGRVKSLRRMDSSGKRNIPESIKANMRQKSGHHVVSLCKDGAKHTYRIHSLVMQAFVGPRPNDSAVIRHLDGNVDNNFLSNLTYGSASENVSDSYYHGSRKIGERNHLARYSDYLVKAIRDEKRLTGESSRLLAAKFGVNDRYVRRVISNQIRKRG